MGVSLVEYVEPRTVLFMRSKLSIAHFLAFSILYARYEAQVCIGSGPFVEIAMKKKGNWKIAVKTNSKDFSIFFLSYTSCLISGTHAHLVPTCGSTEAFFDTYPKAEIWVGTPLGPEGLMWQKMAKDFFLIFLFFSIQSVSLEWKDFFLLYPQWAVLPCVVAGW